MSTYFTHPLNKQVRPNVTDMFDNGRLDGHTVTGYLNPLVHAERTYLTDQDFRRLMNKANTGSENA